MHFHSEPQIDETVARLAQRTFLAADLMAATEITPDQLDLWQRKAGLILCSEPLGRGRARQFCLLDVYLFAMMARLTRLTGSPAWSAVSLGHVIFAPIPLSMQSGPISSIHTVPERRTALCSEIRTAHELFWTRSWHSRPWFFFADESHVQSGKIFGLDVANVENTDSLVHRREGYFLNVTRLLNDVDKRLVAIVEAA